ncbi:MAG: hypothetical protein ACK5N8_04885 [Alphaproteobacteria bacterium]
MLQDVHDELYHAQNLREEIFHLSEEPFNLPEWSEVGQDEALVTGLPNIPVLLTSDIHYGEVVDPVEIDGVNCNVEVANKRIERLTNNTILKLRGKGGKKAPGIVICRLGDTVSGDIHNELDKTNALGPIAAAVECAKQECRMIETFRKEFKNVWIVSVPGNHGRTTKKPESKNFVETSYDSISTMFIEKHFEKAKNVSFLTPKSGEAFFPVYGTNFLAIHGDRIGAKGGTGFIGVSATIAKGQYKTRQKYAQEGKYIDWVLMGHFHRHLKLEHTIVNSNMPGYNQYARDLKLEAEYPSQTLFMVHPRLGVVDVSEIYVSHREEMKEDMAIFKKTKAHEPAQKYVQPSFIKFGKGRNGGR